ncbi:hypothetical protein [Candidatus Palauibacter sp.]|uniref:hypothetical protein n=1 Tax=Candidatus Palauibacter sp. TaxID=3101350 RepID=UPI003B0196EB
MGPDAHASTASNGSTPVGVGGWLLVYLLGSIPFLLLHSAGLSGWFLDYALWLLIAIFLLLASPLALILVKSSRAPRWNIVALWVIALPITLRAAAVPFYQETGGRAQRSPEEWAAAIAILAVIVLGSLAWATIWTAYFRRSLRVRNTFNRS